MGKFGKIIDWIVTIWMVIFNMTVGLILSAFAIVAMFSENVIGSSTWSSMGLTIIAIVMVNLINFLVKILLRSFKR